MDNVQKETRVVSVMTNVHKATCAVVRGKKDDHLLLHETRRPRLTKGEKSSKARQEGSSSDKRSNAFEPCVSHISCALLGARSTCLIMFLDGTGRRGPFSSNPVLRRCGWGVAARDFTDVFAPSMVFGRGCYLPGVEQNVPRSEIYAGFHALRFAPRKTPFGADFRFVYFVERAHPLWDAVELCQRVVAVVRAPANQEDKPQNVRKPGDEMEVRALPPRLGAMSVQGARSFTSSAGGTACGCWLGGRQENGELRNPSARPRVATLR